MDAPNASTTLIAEAGVNHNGEFDNAIALIDVAVNAGCDYIKFQVFNPEQLVTETAPTADYQRKGTNAQRSQHAMLADYALSLDDFTRLKKYASDNGIHFLATPFEAASLQFLVRLGCPMLKIGSGDLTDGPLLLAAARSRRQLILSTGMATLGEIEQALAILAFGYLHPKTIPSARDTVTARLSTEGQAALLRHVSLLHCCSEYPAKPSHINLRAIATLHHAFGLPVGYSDHSQGISIALAAVALGACIIEKHITLDHALPGPDHQASLMPDDLRAMVAGIRDIEQALGDGRKNPVPEELTMRRFARKSVVAAQPISQGELLSAQHLCCKRPGTGTSPMDFWQLLGTPATRDYAKDDLIGQE